MNFYLRNSAFLLITIAFSPFFVIGLIAGLVGCGLRAGWHTADAIALWITE